MLLRTHCPIICKAIIANSNRISYSAVQSTGQRGVVLGDASHEALHGWRFIYSGARLQYYFGNLVRALGAGQSVLIESCVRMYVHPPPLIFHF